MWNSNIVANRGPLNAHPSKTTASNPTTLGTMACQGQQKPSLAAVDQFQRQTPEKTVAQKPVLTFGNGKAALPELQYVTAASYEKDVIEASKTQPVLVDVFATWCGPCKMLSPLLQQIAAEKPTQLKIVKLDGEGDNAMDQILVPNGVQAFPTMLLYQNGEITHRMVGFQPKARILAQLAEKIPNFNAPA